MQDPVLQFLQTPYRLDASAYENAYSPANGQGDLRAAYALWQLVDPIPQMTRNFTPGASCEMTYGAILQGAEGGKKGSYVNSLLERDRESFRQQELTTLSLSPSPWHVATALPAGWMDRKEKAITKVTIDTKTFRIDGLGQGFRMLGVPGDEDWKLGNGAAQQPLGAGTQVHEITMEVVEVAILRNWLDLNLFKTAGWSLPGQDTGYVSDGTLHASNTGVMPLVVSGFLTGRSIAVSATLTPKAVAFLSAGTAGVASLGPFPLVPEALVAGQNSTSQKPADDLYLIAMISLLIPLCPS